MITYADFEKIDMRVGTILEAEEFPRAKNPSYKLKIDFGPFGIKVSSAQITHKYTLKSLPGQQVIAVLNIPKKQIANFFSECLVLGVVGDEKSITLLNPEQPVPNGLRIS